MSEENDLFPAIVVKVLNDFEVVINRGSEHGVKKGSSFLIYFEEREPLLDPVTGESLGKLEIVRGPGRATHVQPKLSTVRSSRSSNAKVVRRRPSNLSAIFGETVEEQEGAAVPFDEPKAGDFAKPI